MTNRPSKTVRTDSRKRWLFVLGSFGSVCYALHTLHNQQKAESCGIVAFVGKEPASGFLLEGLHILQNRGYDSAGLATISFDKEAPKGNSKLNITKFASSDTTSDCVELLEKSIVQAALPDSVGIAHTRWATHGAKTDQNAHPHMDSKNRMALVHNGTIENSDKLKQELRTKGIVFKSQTDTEVIVQLMGTYLDAGLPLLEAVNSTLGRLEGTWGLAIIHKDYPDQIIACRNGSPLVIGIGSDRHFVASEPSAFSNHTNQFISLHDGEVAIVKHNQVVIESSSSSSNGTNKINNTSGSNRIEKMEQEIIERSPAPYEHWTLKEIMEQPEALSRTLSYGARFSSDGSMVKLGGLEGNLDKLLTIQNLLIGACGTSYFAGLYGMKIMQNLQCFDNVQCVDASEITKDVFPQKNNGLLVISQSGETKDTHRSVQLAQHNGIPVFSIINQVGSLIARATNCGVYLRAGREHGVASTKAFTTQVTALALVAGWFSQQRTADDAAYAQAFLSDGTEDSILKLQGQHHLQLRNSRLNSLLQSVHALPVYAGMALRTHDQCKHIAEKLKDKPSLFILGKGFAEPIAYEGALKIKEITYIHAEGYSGGALKHGPFALLEKGTPVILMILDDSHAELMRIAAQEVRARHAYTIVITDKPSLAEGLGDEIITIPHNGPMTALLATIPLQLLAYEISIKKGYNPDKPRNLAKAVTVD